MERKLSEMDNTLASIAVRLTKTFNYCLQFAALPGLIELFSQFMCYDCRTTLSCAAGNDTHLAACY